MPATIEARQANLQPTPRQPEVNLSVRENPLSDFLRQTLYITTRHLISNHPQSVFGKLLTGELKVNGFVTDGVGGSLYQPVSSRVDLQRLGEKVDQKRLQGLLHQAATYNNLLDRGGLSPKDTEKAQARLTAITDELSQIVAATGAVQLQFLPQPPTAYEQKYGPQTAHLASFHEKFVQEQRGRKEGEKTNNSPLWPIIGVPAIALAGRLRKRASYAAAAGLLAAELILGSSCGPNGEIPASPTPVATPAIPATKTPSQPAPTVVITEVIKNPTPTLPSNPRFGLASLAYVDSTSPAPTIEAPKRPGVDNNFLWQQMSRDYPAFVSGIQDQTLRNQLYQPKEASLFPVSSDKPQAFLVIPGTPQEGALLLSYGPGGFALIAGKGIDQNSAEWQTVINPQNPDGATADRLSPSLLRLTSKQTREQPREQLYFIVFGDILFQTRALPESFKKAAQEGKQLTVVVDQKSLSLGLAIINNGRIEQIAVLGTGQILYYNIPSTSTPLPPTETPTPKPTKTPVPPTATATPELVRENLTAIGLNNTSGEWVTKPIIQVRMGKELTVDLQLQGSGTNSSIDFIGSGGRLGMYVGLENNGQGLFLEFKDGTGQVRVEHLNLPSGGRFTLKIGEGGKTIVLLDSNGRTIKQINVTSLDASFANGLFADRLLNLQLLVGPGSSIQIKNLTLTSPKDNPHHIIPPTATPLPPAKEWPADQPLPLVMDPASVDRLTASYPTDWGGIPGLVDGGSLVNRPDTRDSIYVENVVATSLTTIYYPNIKARESIKGLRFFMSNIEGIEKGLYGGQPWLRLSVRLLDGRLAKVDLNLNLAGGGIGIWIRGAGTIFTGINKVNPAILQLSDCFGFDFSQNSVVSIDGLLDPNVKEPYIRLSDGYFLILGQVGPFSK